MDSPTPIQIAVLHTPGRDNEDGQGEWALFALCDDGRIWIRYGNTEDWHKINKIDPTKCDCA